MPNLDAFNSSQFTTRSLSGAIDIIPNQFGRLNDMGLFVDRFQRTRLISIDRRTHTLTILPTVAWGAPATKGGVPTREAIPLSIPHIPVEDLIPAADVQGIRAFGMESELESVQDLVNDKLMALAGQLDHTLEYMKWGALNGTVLDGAGATVLDVATAFNVSRGSDTWTLSNSSTNVDTEVTDMKTYFETNAKGVNYRGIHVFCSQGFWNAFITHARVRAIYQYYINNGRAEGQDYRNRFEAWGVVFEQVPGSGSIMSGSTVYWVPTNEAIAVPVGTDIFQVHYAPADFIETVNTRAQARYAKQVTDPEFQRWVKIHAQSNPLCLCTRPDLIMRLQKN